MDVMDLVNEGKVKRFFRARRKLTAPNIVSHITQRAAGKEPLFLENNDYLHMLWLLKDIAKKTSLRIYAFCLMPNHVHLLLSPEEENLQDAMRGLFSRYASRFNRKYERKGHLFGGRYRQAVCLDDSYLLAASLYIHLNPVRAGIAPHPAQYRWSSCRLYTDSKVSKSFVDAGFILTLLPENKKEKYVGLLERGMTLELNEVMEQEDAIESFREKLVSLHPLIFARVARLKKIIGHSGLQMMGMEELEDLVKDTKEGFLPGKPKGREAKRYLIEQLISRGYKREEIAKQLAVSRKTIYNILKPSL
ncbi:MAG: transposase [Deltaproteobacteria bacterium]|jgi:putative transposase